MFGSPRQPVSPCAQVWVTSHPAPARPLHDRGRCNMRQNVHSYTRAAEAVPLTGTSETAFYPDDLVSELQSTLAALTTLEIRHEIKRDCLEEWSGPGEV